MYPDGDQDEDEDDDVPDDEERLGGDEVGKECSGDDVNLVAGADEDEGCEEDVDDWIVWYEDQDTVCVSTQPYVILTDK